MGKRTGSQPHKERRESKQQSAQAPMGSVFKEPRLHWVGEEVLGDEAGCLPGSGKEGTEMGHDMMRRERTREWGEQAAVRGHHPGAHASAFNRRGSRESREQQTSPRRLRK